MRTAVVSAVRGPLEALDHALSRPARPAVRAVQRLREAAVALLLVVLAFSSAPGRTSNDTKLDLTEDPAGWLAGGLQVWTPDALGSLQNQAYGYLFPMGPFHLAGIAAGLPGWVVQRLWWSVLLVAAFLGVVRLAERVGVGTPATRLVAGAAYALSPRVLTELGGLSSELLPLAALPWVLLPLVAPGRVRVAAARSGVAVLLAGAVNAAATLAVLPLAAVWLVPGLRTRPGRRLAAWWVLSVSLACSWWLVPLLVQGAYSPPFLDYIETAEITTLVTSPVEVLRGTTHWLAYLDTGAGPWWRSGWTLVTAPAVVLDTAVVAGLGAAGLCARGMPARRRLVATALLGAAAMTLGHDGPLASPLAEQARALLDGPLAPFRNVHKADPLVRLPLVLGLCHVLTLLPDLRARRSLVLVAVVGIVGTATPALAGQLVPDGAWLQVPSYWQEASDWVDEHAGRTSTLLVPAASDAEHVWGRPLDDPLQVLAEAPVVVRDAVPLGGPEVTRLLDAVGARLDSGRGSPGLATVLARAGVGHVVVRNDLDRRRTGAPRPVLVAQALQRSPGLRRVQSFGPLLGDDAVRDGVVVDRGLDVPVRAVDVYAVERPVGPVAVQAQQGAWRLDAGPEGVLQLADRGLLRPEDAVVRVGDGDDGDGRLAATDGLRRRDVDVGRVRDSTTTTSEAGEGEGVRLPETPEDRLVTARWEGVRDVRASSSAADLDAVLDRALESAPASALDGDRRTAWVSGGLEGAVGEWLEVELEEPRDLRGATVVVGGPELSELQATLTALEVRTDTGSARTLLTGEDGVRQPLTVPRGPTRTLRVTVAGIEGEDGFGRLAGLRELALPDVTADRTVVVPRAELSGDAVLLLDEPVGARDGCVDAGRQALCSPALPRAGEEPAPLDRVVDLAAPARVPLTGGARPVPGPALDALLDAGAPVQVRASSRSVLDPRGRPATVLDGDLGSGWTAAEGDEEPELELRWPGPQQVEGLQLLTGRLPVARPLRVEVEADGLVLERRVARDGRVPLPPLRTDLLRVRVVAREQVVDVSTTGRLSALPVGVAEVRVLGAQELPPVDPGTPVVVGCGDGPSLAAGAQVLPLRLLGTRRDLVELRPLLAQACTPDGTVALGAGETRLRAARGAFDVTSLTLGAALPQPQQPERRAAVLRWSAEERVVDVGPGQASWLVVHEAVNRGWTATLDGVQLEPARLDGWQQGFVLPAGPGGEVRLVYGPGRVHRAGLAVGAGLVALLLGLSLGRRGPPAVAAAARPVAPGRRRVVATRRVAQAAPPALLALLAGVPGLAVWAAAALLRRAVPLPLLAAGGTLAAGAVVAWAPWSGPRDAGALSAAAAVPALLALAALAASLSERGASGAGPVPPPPAGSAPPSPG